MLLDTSTRVLLKSLRKLGVSSPGLDPGLFFKVQGKQLCGIVACYVDDFFAC